MGGVRTPHVLPAGGPLWFPDPEEFDEEGCVMIGADLAPERLLVAYRSGIFPWHAEDLPLLWWSPDPRAVIDPRTLHVSRSLGRRLRRASHELTWNRCFSRVVRECASGEGREGRTWILPEMVDAYCALHERGNAHSLEVWEEGELAGGIYGVQVGGLFAAESMFHRRRDASKIALVALVRSLFRAGIELMDVQFATPHLKSMGAVEIPRKDYLKRAKRASRRAVSLEGLPVSADP
ncbi:MAG: leucyl/phenylalanyl-tRNA--protein transferase [Planctomycetota bacterium]